MGNIIKLSAILFFVAGIAAGSLAFYNSITKPEIAKLKAKNEKIARAYVLQGLFTEDQMSTLIYEEGEIDLDGTKEKFWKVKTSETGQYKALVFLAKGMGFSGVVETMIGTDLNFKINGIKVLKHTETPGLGAEVLTKKYEDIQKHGDNAKPFFEGWFAEKSSLKVVVVNDDLNSKDKVQSITGATITTRAVCKSINKYAELVQKQMGNMPRQLVIDQAQVVAAPKDAILKARAEAAAKAEAQKNTVVTEDTPEGGKDE
ncbi:MAG: FMN-binding protein [Candidatus Delongbacteria bacterium]|jgi:electron transport complex protein RnfG|nr:FMN-binding protein [Candidatus Delongbacteria bacterium]